MPDLNRFLRLERARPDRPPERREETPSRFEGVGEHPATTHQDGRPPGYGAKSPGDGSEPKLHFKEDDGGPSLVRCCHCKMDNSGSALRCAACGLNLRTPEQRAFNEALWHSMQEEQAERQREREQLEQQERKARAERAAEAILGEAEAMRRTTFPPLGGRGFGNASWERTSWGSAAALTLLIRALPAPCRRPSVWLPILAVLNTLTLAIVLHLGIGYGLWTVLLILQAAVAFEIWVSGE
jgi:hypothetical protein